jgi:PAS domain S-box-containing protein
MIRRLLPKSISRLSLQLVLWALLAALPSLLFGGWLFTAVYRELTETRQRAAQTVAQQALGTLDHLVFERYGDTLVFSGLPLVRALDRPQLPVIADHLVTTYAPYYCLAMVVDQRGAILAVNQVDGAGQPIPSAQLVGRDVSRETWFQQALAAGQPVLIEDFHQDPLVDEIHHDQRPVLSFSAPIRNPAGVVVGIWTTRMNMGPIEELVAKLGSVASPASSPYPLILRSSQGQILLRVGLGPQKAGPMPPLVLLATATSTGFSRAPALGWNMEAYQPPGVVDDRTVIAALAAWLGLVLIGGVFGLGWMTHRRFIRPVLALTELAKNQVQRARSAPMAQMVEQPELAATLGTRSDELGELTRAVETMAQEAQGQVARLVALNAVVGSFQRETVSLSSLLTRIVSTARELTGAKYAALGVFDEAGERLTQFITAGIDEATRAAIGALPTGRGLLGHINKDQGVLRLKNLTQHEASWGVPAHHPPMTSFMGVALQAHGKLFGRLYLTDKQGSEGVPVEFTDLDEQVLAALAYQAGAAIEAAHLFEHIQKSESRLRALLDSVQEGIYGIDFAGRCLFLNKAGAATLGYEAEELIGRPMHPLVHHTRADGTPYPLEDCRVHAAPRAAHAVRSDNEILWRRDGTAVSVVYVATPLRDASDTLIGAVVSFADVSEQKRLEEQLRHAQKMEAIGRLAGGIAHDFNNLLTAILGYSGLLLQGIDASDVRYADLREIQKAGERARALTSQLLAISRRQVLAPRVLDLNTVVAGMDGMLRRLLSEEIALLVVPAPDLGRVKADPGQIEQVMLNLALNSRDAMPQGGRVTIETANVELDEAYCRTHAEVSPGSYVMLAVSDTGVGMDAGVLTRCFEPFFTTKPVGKGTGLGLATVYGIVKQSGGSIWVYSEPGLGTAFKVYLPRVADDPLGAEPVAPPAAPGRGTETILLAEDDEAVRTFARRALAGAGYTVLEAPDGEEALRMSARYEGTIHLLITDVVMPGIPGRVLAERLASERPELNVLYVSGYTENAIVHNGVLDPGTAFLHKPLTVESLLQKVREVLDA